MKGLVKYLSCTWLDERTSGLGLSGWISGSRAQRFENKEKSELDTEWKDRFEG